MRVKVIILGTPPFKMKLTKVFFRMLFAVLYKKINLRLDQKHLSTVTSIGVYSVMKIFIKCVLFFKLSNFEVGLNPNPFEGLLYATNLDRFESAQV